MYDSPRTGCAWRLPPQCEVSRLAFGLSNCNKVVLWPGCEGVPGATFTKRMCDRYGSLQKGEDVVATSQLAFRWKCDSSRTECAWWVTHKHMWREQAIIEWSRRVISVVACCHSMKLCELAARAFRSQQKKYASLSFTWPIQCILDYPAMLGNLFGRIRKVSIVGCPPSTTYTTLKRT